MSPKERLLKTTNAKTTAEILALPELIAAADVALLEFMANQGQASGLEEAARNAFKLEGARSYMAELLSIARPPTKIKPVISSQNLT